MSCFSVEFRAATEQPRYRVEMCVVGRPGDARTLTPRFCFRRQHLTKYELFMSHIFSPLRQN